MSSFVYLGHQALRNVFPITVSHLILRRTLQHGETEGQRSPLLKTTELVCSEPCSPTLSILPTAALLQRRKGSFESEENILIPKPTWPQVQSRHRCRPPVWELPAHPHEQWHMALVTKAEVCREPGSGLRQPHPIFLRSSQKLCSSASQGINLDPGVQLPR